MAQKAQKTDGPTDGTTAQKTDSLTNGTMAQKKDNMTDGTMAQKKDSLTGKTHRTPGARCMPVVDRSLHVSACNIFISCYIRNVPKVHCLSSCLSISDLH